MTVHKKRDLASLAKSPKQLENCGAEAQNRTGDTRIFSPLLYRLSYLGILLIVYGVEDCAAAMVLGWYFVST